MCVCRTYQGADISSNHSFVMCKLKLRLKRTPRQRRQEPQTDIELLDNAVRRKALSDQVEKGSPGIDDITGEMNQAVGEKVVEELHALCNQIWKEGIIPEEWAKSVIITIPKKGDLSHAAITEQLRS